MRLRRGRARPGVRPATSRGPSDRRVSRACPAGPSRPGKRRSFWRFEKKGWRRGESNPCPKHHLALEIRGLPEAHRRVSCPLVTVRTSCLNFARPAGVQPRVCCVPGLHPMKVGLSLIERRVLVMAPGPQLSREGLAEVVAVVGSLVLGLMEGTQPCHALRRSDTPSKPVRPRKGNDAGVGVHDPPVLSPAGRASTGRLTFLPAR